MRTEAQAHQQIINFVERRKSARVTDVAEFIHMNPDAVRKHLDKLIELDRAHRVMGSKSKDGSRAFIYFAGPAPKPAPKQYAPLRVVDPWMLPAGFFQGGQAA